MLLGKAGRPAHFADHAGPQEADRTAELITSTRNRVDSGVQAGITDSASINGCGHGICCALVRRQLSFEGGEQDDNSLGRYLRRAHATDVAFASHLFGTL